MVAYQDRLQSGFREANENFGKALERPTELVKDYPFTSMLVLFGIGLGVGVVVSQALCGALSEALQPEPTMSEKVKRQVYDAVSSVIPPSVLRQIQSYTS